MGRREYKLNIYIYIERERERERERDEFKLITPSLSFLFLIQDKNFTFG